MDKTCVISCYKELAIGSPIDGCEIISELLTSHDHLIVLPQSNCLVCATRCEDLLFRMDSTAPKLCLGHTLEVTINMCLNLSAIGGINFNDLSATGADQEGLR